LIGLAASAVFFTSILTAIPARADRLPLPTATYSADVTSEARGRETTGHIYVDGPKERRELKNAAGVTTVTIIRRDQGKVYNLRPARHLAVAMRIAAAEAAGETGAPGIDVDTFYGTDATPQGQETVSGLPTTKYLIKIDGGPGLTVDATVWATTDGIVARVIGKTSIDDSPARMELKNVVRGAQDAALFEVPAGTEVLSAGADSDSSGPTPAAPQAQAPQVPPPAAAPPAPAVPSGAPAPAVAPK